MQNEIEMLRSIRQSTEMGCSGIRAVLPEAQNPAMQSALRSQWKEYDSIYAEADRLLRERGVRLSGVNPLAKYGSMLTAKLRVRSSRNTTARIAEMLVQGNTRGMVKSMQNLRAMGVLDPKVSSLSTRLLQTEQANIEEMKHFLSPAQSAETAASSARIICASGMEATPCGACSGRKGTWMNPARTGVPA